MRDESLIHACKMSQLICYQALRSGSEVRFCMYGQGKQMSAFVRVRATCHLAICST